MIIKYVREGIGEYTDAYDVYMVNVDNTQGKYFGSVFFVKEDKAWFSPRNQRTGYRNREEAFVGMMRLRLSGDTKEKMKELL